MVTPPPAPHYQHHVIHQTSVDKSKLKTKKCKNLKTNKKVFLIPCKDKEKRKEKKKKEEKIKNSRKEKEKRGKRKKTVNKKNYQKKKK
jgi:hypothetical protein